jgi:23S rRNA (pseudouridine1915-N3)-methyltransferase
LYNNHAAIGIRSIKLLFLHRKANYYLKELFMKIALVQTGKTTDKNVAGIADLYHSRIIKYNAFEIITLPDLKNSGNLPVQEQKIKEGKKILQTVNSEDYIVILDEKGRELRTTEFSGWMEKTFMISKKRIVFIIGGPWGFSDEVYKRADFRISLSKMTFPHQLVRLLFLEQLYRAFTIMKGEPYHHE